MQCACEREIKELRLTDYLDSAEGVVVVEIEPSVYYSEGSFIYFFENFYAVIFPKLSDFIFIENVERRGHGERASEANC